MQKLIKLVLYKANSYITITKKNLLFNKSIFILFSRNIILIYYEITGMLTWIDILLVIYFSCKTIS